MYNKLKNTKDIYYNNYTLTVMANRQRRIEGKRISDANRIEMKKTVFLLLRLLGNNHIYSIVIINTMRCVSDWITKVPRRPKKSFKKELGENIEN